MKLGRIVAAAAAVTLAVSTAAVTVSADEQPEMRDISTMELVREMGLGINLGNTFESCGSWINDSSVTNFETAWGSPVITKEMIEGYADCGFGVVRIPVAWSNMMGEDYTIDPEYMARVKEVVDWTVDSGMYAIVNIHWDGGWWEKFPTDEQESMYRYERMWNQICDGFEDYDDHVMFESLNEEGGWDSLWNKYNPSNTNGKDTSYDLLNRINQKFVDIVRASGGNNPKRHLLIAGYNTDIQLTCDPLFVMPDDPENRCAVSVHYYTPAEFCILEEDADWGKARTEWGTDADYQQLNSNMNLMKETFIDKGIPVIVGEYGCTTKNKTQENSRKFLTAACEAMYTRGMCPVLWDITYSEDHSLSFYDRYTCEMRDPELKNAFAQISGMAVKNTPEISVEDQYNVTYGDEGFNLNASATGDGKLTYTSSDDSIVSVDEEGNVTILSAGTAVITVSTEETEEYLPASKEVTVKVSKISAPPVYPEEKITVDLSVTSTDDIELPEGWKWLKTYELTEEVTTVTAVYADTNYDNRIVSIEIIRKDLSTQTPDDDNNANEPDDDNVPSDKPSTDGNDSNPPTGAAVTISAIAAASLLAAVELKKKK